MTTERVRLYERLPVTEDVDWWRTLASGSPDGAVLYVGCGAGRLAIPLAEVCDRLVGVDRDPEMAAASAARLPASLAERVEIVAARLEDLELDRHFGLVVVPSSLLNEIVEPPARLRALTAAARHCHRDGRVVLQVLNPYWLAGEALAVQGTITAADGSSTVRVSISDGSFDVWEQRRRADIRYGFADGEVLVDRLDAVALFPWELRTLVDDAGLEFVEAWGGRPGRDRLDRTGGTWHLVCRTRASGPQ